MNDDMGFAAEILFYAAIGLSVGFMLLTSLVALVWVTG